jgi:hypothetical protein
VNGDYVAFARCRGLCAIYRYRISTRTTRQITNRIGSLRLTSPAVLSDGTVYYVKGDNDCGGGVKLQRFRNGHVTTVRTFPDWIDVGHLEARILDGRPVVIFTRELCKWHAPLGIYRING